MFRRVRPVMSHQAGISRGPPGRWRRCARRRPAAPGELLAQLVDQVTPPDAGELLAQLVDQVATAELAHDDLDVDGHLRAHHEDRKSSFPKNQTGKTDELSNRVRNLRFAACCGDEMFDEARCGGRKRSLWCDTRSMDRDRSTPSIRHVVRTPASISRRMARVST